MSSPTKEWITMLDQQITKDFANTDYNQSKSYLVKLPISVIAGIKLSTLTAEVTHYNNEYCNNLIFALRVNILNNYHLHSITSHGTHHDNIDEDILDYHVHSDNIKISNDDKSDFRTKVFNHMCRLHSVLSSIRFSKLNDRLTRDPIHNDEHTLGWIDICKNLPNCEPLYGVCSVCLDETSTVTKCKHYLCRYCSQKLKSNTCPTCRLQLNESNEDVPDSEDECECEDECENCGGVASECMCYQCECCPEGCECKCELCGCCECGGECECNLNEVRSTC